MVVRYGGVAKNKFLLVVDEIRQQLRCDGDEWKMSATGIKLPHLLKNIFSRKYVSILYSDIIVKMSSDAESINEKIELNQNETNNEKIDLYPGNTQLQSSTIYSNKSLMSLSFHSPFMRVLFLPSQLTKSRFN